MSDDWLRDARVRYVQQLDETTASTMKILRAMIVDSHALPRDKARATRLLAQVERDRKTLPALRRQVGIDVETDPPHTEEGPA